jgi:hypothetical protein
MNLTEIPAICGEKVENDKLLKDFLFWGPGVAVSVVGSIGLAGNVLSVVAIASMPKPRITLFHKVSKASRGQTGERNMYYCNMY